MFTLKCWDILPTGTPHFHPEIVFLLQNIFWGRRRNFSRPQEYHRGVKCSAETKTVWKIVISLEKKNQNANQWWWFRVRPLGFFDGTSNHGFEKNPVDGFLSANGLGRWISYRTSATIGSEFWRTVVRMWSSSFGRRRPRLTIKPRLTCVINTKLCSVRRISALQID
jgi:hypothetical protein